MEGGFSQIVIWVLVGIIFLPLFFLSELAFYHAAQMFDDDLGNFGDFHILVGDVKESFGRGLRRGWKKIIGVVSKVPDGILVLPGAVVIPLYAPIKEPKAANYLPVSAQEVKLPSHDINVRVSVLPFH